MDIYLLRPQPKDNDWLLADDGREWLERWQLLYSGQPVGDRWQSVTTKLIDEDGTRAPRPSDFPVLTAGIPVFSRRAVNTLQDLLAEAGELLPITCPGRDYSVFNVTTVYDAFDEAGSTVERVGSGHILRVLRYAFFLDRIGQAAIFRVKGAPLTDIFVTQALVDRVRAAGLTGFETEYVWSNDAGGDVREASWRTAPLHPARDEEARADAGKSGEAAQQSGYPGRGKLTDSGDHPAASETTEESLTSEERGEIEYCVACGLEELDLALPCDDSSAIVEAIANFIRAGRISAIAEAAERERTILFLGCLWGEMVCRAHGWEWTKLRTGGQMALAVVSPDRAYANLPIPFVARLIDDPKAGNKLVLTFNMLERPRVQAGGPSCYRLLG